MTPDQVFSIANTTAALAWTGLVLFQHRRWARDIVVISAVALFAIVYVAIVATTFGQSDGGFSTLTGVATLFGNRWLLVAGWVHYLAFDLLVGRWEVLDAERLAIPRWLMAPILVLTFMFGPAGWLMYAAVQLRYRSAAAVSGVTRWVWC